MNDIKEKLQEILDMPGEQWYSIPHKKTYENVKEFITKICSLWPKEMTPDDVSAAFDGEIIVIWDKPYLEASFDGEEIVLYGNGENKIKDLLVDNAMTVDITINLIKEWRHKFFEKNRQKTRLTIQL